jgi:hypothetical protein
VVTKRAVVLFEDAVVLNSIQDQPLGAPYVGLRGGQTQRILYSSWNGPDDPR